MNVPVISVNSYMRHQKLYLHPSIEEKWNLMQNELSQLHELRTFLVECRKCPTLREVGCKPFELHALFAGLYVHTAGPPPLSDDDQVELAGLADSLNLEVF